MPCVKETKYTMHRQKKKWQFLWKWNQCCQPLHVQRIIFNKSKWNWMWRKRKSIIANLWSCLRGEGGQCNLAEQNFGWLQLDILIAIDRHATPKRANVILHWFFGRPREPTWAWTENKNKSYENDAMRTCSINPGIIIVCHHIRFCIACIAVNMSSFLDVVIGSNIKSIKSACWSWPL